MATLRGDAVYRSASFFRRSVLALGRWLPTFRAMAISSPLKNSHSRTIPRRMPAHVGAGVPANINKHRGLSPRSYDVALGRSNHLYSVAALTNQAGGVVERYRYDTFGNRTTLAPDGITTRAASLYNQQVGFTGRYLDKETGLWYFRARYYSGSLGRFVSRDPIGYRGGGMGLYNGYFVPNYLDPTGQINEGSGYPIFQPDGTAPIVPDLPDWPAYLMTLLTSWRGAVGEGLPRTLLDQWYYRRGDIDLTVGQVEELWIRETMKKVEVFNADVAKAAKSGRLEIWKKVYEYPLFTVGRSRTLGQIGGMKLSSTVIVCNEKWWVVGELSLSDKYDFDPRPPGQRHPAAEQMVIIMNKIHEAGFGKDFTASASGVPFSQDYTMDKMKIGSGGGGDPGIGGGIPPVVQ